MWRALRMVGLALAIASVGHPTIAQELESGKIVSPILVIDSDRLYRQSKLGQRTEDAIAKRRDALAAEQRTAEEELRAEELALTEKRKTMTPEEFRPLAEAFDKQVQEIRRLRTDKIKELEAELAQERDAFLRAAAPILEKMMIESEAAVILERRTTFFSANNVDVTDEAIQRLDALLAGDAETSPDSAED